MIDISVIPSNEDGSGSLSLSMRDRNNPDLRVTILFDLIKIHSADKNSGTEYPYGGPPGTGQADCVERVLTTFFKEVAASKKPHSSFMVG